MDINKATYAIDAKTIWDGIFQWKNLSTFQQGYVLISVIQLL